MTDKQKKKFQKAERSAVQAELTHCRYLIRNPKFSKDLKRLQRACKRFFKHECKPPPDVPRGPIRASDYLSRYGPGTPYGHYQQKQGRIWKAVYKHIEQMQQKWQFPLTDSAIRKMPPVDNPRFTKYLDAWLSRYFKRVGLYQISPVEMWREFPYADGRFIDFHLRIDRTHPLSELLPLIGDRLNFILSPIAPQPGRARRRRPDKADFNLKVFDLAFQEQKTFSAIARQLHQRPSTVKSAYLVASRNIFGKPLRKKEALRAAFDPHNHIPNCPTCKIAQRPDKFCPKALAWINQAYKSQRELTGFNTIVAVAPKSVRGY